MHSANYLNAERIYSLHLTVQSVELVRGSLSSACQISVSCDISEIPSVNCTLLFNKKQQDIGIIGSLKFDEKRPVAVASINLGPEPYDELRDLLSNNPARPASIYLKTSKFQEDSKGIIRVKNTGLCLDISDLSWRYPIL